MLHPVGSLPPAVYWRRRLMVGGAVAAVILVVLTVFALRSNGTTPVGSGKPKASSPAPVTSHSSSAPATTTPPPTSPATSAGTTPVSSPAGSSSPASPASTNAAPAACIAAQLTISATSQAPTYKVGDEPVLILQVVNNGPGNCTQDLADSQVELRVYNGAARVWGSHDCLVQPGTSVKTLVPGATVGVQVTWSGLSSQPACAGTRQRVGAGTYTLYPYLAGAQGTAAQFTIS